MFQRFHAAREEREGGFTLIELLVVILIIAILAAIAIPVFLNQRKKGWISQSESALKNGATAMESYATGHEGKYPRQAQINELRTEGFRPVTNVTLSIVDANTADGQEFCLKAVHALLDGADKEMYWDSDVGKPSTTACTSQTATP